MDGGLKRYIMASLFLTWRADFWPKPTPGLPKPRVRCNRRTISRFPTSPKVSSVVERLEE